MRPGTLTKYNKVKSLIESGMTQTEALAKVGMAAPTYRQVKDDRSLVPIVKKQHEYIDLVAKEESNVIIVVCKADQLKTIMGELK